MGPDMANWMSYFSGRHALVTGGSSGIGKALALDLASAGARLTLVARRPELLASAKAEILAATPDAAVDVIPLDISVEAEVEAKIGPHLDAHPVQMLINNAGIARPGRFVEQTTQDFRDHMDINYFGMVHMCRAVVPRLMEAREGHVANVGSLLSKMGIYGYSAYAASKFAMQGFSECLRGELKPFNVHVTMLNPPDTDTPQHTAEMELLPPETKAIAGTVKMLSAETVARSLLQGMAQQRFEVVPGLDGQATVIAHRVWPGLVRWVCDRSQAKVLAG